MKKKILIVMLLSVVFLTGCEFTTVGRNEHEFNVNIINYKKFTVELENANYEEEKYGVISLKKDELIRVTYKMIGSSAAKVSVYESSEGEYEVVIFVEPNGTTGEIEIYTEESKSTNNS